MSTNKSAAQIRRLIKRAASRGEKYDYTPKPKEEEEKAQITKPQSKIEISATKLRRELLRVEKDQELLSKERRSAKRKAYAIAAEEAMCDIEEITKWYNDNLDEIDKKLLSEGPAKTIEKKSQKKKRSLEEDSKDNEATKKKKGNPYIVFIGQLSYTTTVDILRKHLYDELKEHHPLTTESFRIRLLTDKKRNNRSRGMAFVEVDNPELLYGCLKMHHTQLDGRRINVERTVGGKNGTTNNTTNDNNEENDKRINRRAEKLKGLREDQIKHLSGAVDHMFQEHYDNGTIQKNELDDATVDLCKRHAPSTAEMALALYVEKNGREMDNPSAYFTYLVGKIAMGEIIPEKNYVAGDSKDKIRTNNYNNRTREKGGDVYSEKRTFQ